MTVDISTFTSTLQNKLNNASSLPEKDLLLLTKSLEAFSSVYDMKDMATAINQINTYVNTELAGVETTISTALSDIAQPVLHTNNPTYNTAGSTLGQLWFNTTTGEAWYYGGTGLLGTYKWFGFGASAGEQIAKTIGTTYANGINVNNNTSVTKNFTVPSGVTSISACLVGSGGSGYYSWSSAAGGGGALAWANFTVTPGEVLTLTIPGRATGTNQGRPTILESNSRGELFRAQGGQHSATSRNTSYGNPVAGAITPGNIDSGRGGLTSQNGYGGGGGAGGYTGSGGNGSYGNTRWSNNPFNDSQNGTGGAGGGSSGYESSTYGFAGAGGVGLYGEGESGQGVTGNLGNDFSSQYQGKGGSGGFDGAPSNNSTSTAVGGENTGIAPYNIYHGEGGAYGGGGGGGGTSVSNNTITCAGGCGGARLLIGGSYPNNASHSGVDETIIAN
jgi:hypothetical protein